MYKHPLELVKIAQESRLNDLDTNSKKYISKKTEIKSIQKYDNFDNIVLRLKIQNLQSELVQVKEVVKKLEKEYNDEMAHREKLQKLFNN